MSRSSAFGLDQRQRAVTARLLQRTCPAGSGQTHDDAAAPPRSGLGDFCHCCFCVRQRTLCSRRPDQALHLGQSMTGFHESGAVRVGGGRASAIRPDAVRRSSGLRRTGSVRRCRPRLSPVTSAREVRTQDGCTVSAMRATGFRYGQRAEAAQAPGVNLRLSWSQARWLPCLRLSRGSSPRSRCRGCRRCGWRRRSSRLLR